MLLHSTSIFILYSLIALVWFALIYLAMKNRGTPSGRTLKRCAHALYILILIETVAVGFFRIRSNTWLWNSYNPNVEMFERDPVLTVAPRKNVSRQMFGTTISHNSAGFRGPEIAPESAKFRIAAIGGSTTYGVKVNDDQSWPALLQQELGPNYEVINFGIPGHSTAEHLQLMKQIVPAFKPDLVLILAGINDLHLMHIAEIDQHYAPAQPAMLFHSFGLCPQNLDPKIGLFWAGRTIFEHLGWTARCGYSELDLSGPKSREIDPRVLTTFRKNLLQLATLSAEIEATVVYIPQILVEERLRDGSYQWWNPLVDQQAMVSLLQIFNQAMAEIAEQTDANFVNQVTQHPWQAADFIDADHLNGAANGIFAKIITDFLRRSVLFQHES